MHPQLIPFLLPFFESDPKIVSLLKTFSKKQKSTDLAKVTKAFLKKIEKYKQDLKTDGLPPFLEIATVNQFIQWGIFLKPDAKPLKKGTFIGIYSGILEIVFATETKDNHYAYDLATNIKIHREHLPLVRSKTPSPTLDEDYSIQINAEKNGNFTRYINHSSIDTNIDAFAKRMPDDTVVICLVTKKTIHPGEQLLSNYGGMYWAVLPIIPEPALAKSYKINKNGVVEKKEKDLFPCSERVKQLLLTLRNPIEPDIDSLPKHFRSFVNKSRIKTLPSSIETKIDTFEDHVLERGLPMHLVIEEEMDHMSWKVKLKEDAKQIRKGSFVGALSGEWIVCSHPDSSKIPTTIVNKGQTLMFDREKHANFTRLIPLSSEGNLELLLYRKKEDNTLYLVLKAKRDIRPGEILCIQK